MRISDGIITKMDMSFTDDLDGTVTGRWVVTGLALVEGMNQVIAQFDSPGRERIERLLDAPERYVDTGEMRS